MAMRGKTTTFVNFTAKSLAAAFVAVIFWALGYTFLEMARHEESIHSSGTVGKVPPQLIKRDIHAVSLNNAGNEYLKQREWNKAESMFRQALKEGGGSTTTTTFSLYGLAQSLSKQNRIQESYIAYLNVYLGGASHTILDTDPEALSQYALTCDKAGHWEQAVQVYEKVLQYLPILSDAPALNFHFNSQVRQSQELRVMLHLALGIVYSNRGEKKQALAAFTEAFRLQPNQAMMQFYLGYGLKNAGRSQEAQAAFEKAASLGQGEVKAAAQKMLR